ncbi:MAG: cyclic nucleotide-binding domain-containing protein [Candidatus Schekmanbacteria bacterium]|nr:cyclic nucleotide-binding domain-containing protein [Candidatus Schekmanbacteria bacterium]
MEAIFELLADIPIFADLSNSDLEKVAKLLKAETYERGDTIVHEGQVADRFLIVRTGLVDVLRPGERSDALLFTIEPGGHFGEAALAGQFPRTASVRARRTSLLFSLSHAAFQQLLAEDPAIGAKVLVRIVTELLDRLRHTSGELVTVLVEGSSLSPDAVSRLVR